MNELLRTKPCVCMCVQRKQEVQTRERLERERWERLCTESLMRDRLFRLTHFTGSRRRTAHTTTTRTSRSSRRMSSKSPQREREDTASGDERRAADSHMSQFKPQRPTASMGELVFSFLNIYTASCTCTSSHPNYHTCT